MKLFVMLVIVASFIAIFGYDGAGKGNGQQHKRNEEVPAKSAETKPNNSKLVTEAPKTSNQTAKDSKPSSTGNSQYINKLLKGVTIPEQFRNIDIDKIAHKAAGRLKDIVKHRETHY